MFPQSCPQNKPRSSVYFPTSASSAFLQVSSTSCLGGFSGLSFTVLTSLSYVISLTAGVIFLIHRSDMLQILHLLSMSLRVKVRVSWWFTKPSAFSFPHCDLPSSPFSGMECSPSSQPSLLTDPGTLQAHSPLRSLCRVFTLPVSLCTFRSSLNCSLSSDVPAVYSCKLCLVSFVECIMFPFFCSI